MRWAFKHGRREGNSIDEIRKSTTKPGTYIAGSESNRDGAFGADSYRQRKRCCSLQSRPIATADLDSSGVIRAAVEPEKRCA